MTRFRYNLTKAGALASSYVPLLGEPLTPIDVNDIRVGDGVHTYANLPAASAGSGTTGPTIGIDTDGVPYIDQSGADHGMRFAIDTDGVPYITGA